MSKCALRAGQVLRCAAWPFGPLKTRRGMAGQKLRLEERAFSGGAVYWHCVEVPERRAYAVSEKTLLKHFKEVK